MFGQVAAALIVFPFVARSADAQAACARPYTVKAGDYCDKISAANKCSTYQLWKTNTPTVNDLCTNLLPGQVICLAAKADASDCQDIYVVKSGDYCKKVADNAKIDIKFLYQNNPQINSACTNIYVGEVLCVANSAKVTGPQLPTTTTKFTTTTVLPSPGAVPSGSSGSATLPPLDNGGSGSLDDITELAGDDTADPTSETAGSVVLAPADIKKSDALQVPKEPVKGSSDSSVLNADDAKKSNAAQPSVAQPGEQSGAPPEDDEADLEFCADEVPKV